MLRVYVQLAMSVYRKYTFRRNDCFNVDDAEFNFEEETVGTRTRYALPSIGVFHFILLVPVETETSLDGSSIGRQGEQ